MTSQPERSVPDPTAQADSAAAEQGDLLALSRLVAAGDIDVIAGDPPVPISVWRVAGTDQPTSHDPAHGLTPHLAAALVATFSRRGETILDLTNDPAIAGAAGAGARRYLPALDPIGPDDLEHLAGAVNLIVLRWPRPDLHPGGTGGVTDLFNACRTLLVAGGFTVVALVPPVPGPPYVEHATLVIPAAHQAGLGYLQHIIAVTAPITGQPAPQLTTPADRATRRAATHTRAHLDLLVFVLRRSRASSAKPKNPRRRQGRSGGRHA